MRTRFYKSIRILFITLLIGLLTTVASATDYYRIFTNAGVAQIAGDQIDSVKVENATIKFYNAINIERSFTLSNVDSITFSTIELPVARTIDYITFADDTATINWGETGNAMDIEYQATDGTTKNIYADGNVTSTACPGAKTQVGLFKFRRAATAEATIAGEWFQWSLPQAPIYMIGSSTPEHEQGLDYAVEIPFDESNPGIYVWTGTLQCFWDWGDGGNYYDGGIRFLSSRSYSGGISFNCLPVAGIPSAAYNQFAPISSTPIPVQSYYHKGNSQDWWLYANQRGTYKITLNLNVMTVKFEKLD